MSKIEDRLWSELVREHATELELASPAPTHRQRRVRRSSLAIGGLGLAGAITAATLALTAATSPPAFALTQNADSTVTLTINELVGVTGANEQLAKLGISAHVARIEAGCTATGQPTDPTGEPLETTPLEQDGILQSVPAEGIASWRINPSAIPAGDTLSLLATQRELVVHGGPAPGSRITAQSFGAALYRGQAPACYPPPQEG